MSQNMVDPVNTSLILQLETEFGSQVATGAAEFALAQAVADLEASIKSDSLPQMAYCLARHRLSNQIL